MLNVTEYELINIFRHCPTRCIILEFSATCAPTLAKKSKSKVISTIYSAYPAQGPILCSIIMTTRKCLYSKNFFNYPCFQKFWRCETPKLVARGVILLAALVALTFDSGAVRCQVDTNQRKIETFRAISDWTVGFSRVCYSVTAPICDS